jgi:hypothetical protein
MPNSRVGLSILVTIQLLVSVAAKANADFIEVKLTPAIRESCHIVRFPNGWKLPRLDDGRQGLRIEQIDYNESDYEFRVEGLLGTRFLIGAFKPRLPRRYDATNRYRVNLSDPTALVLAASGKDWEAAAVVPLARKSIMPPLGLPGYDWHDYQAVFNGFKFTKSGYLWPTTSMYASRLSPDSAWVVLQSKTSAKKSPYLSLYRMFFDVFNANTGRKALTIEGTYSGYDDPDGCRL